MRRSSGKNPRAPLGRNRAVRKVTWSCAVYHHWHNESPGVIKRPFGNFTGDA